jgi:hypothetical protein
MPLLISIIATSILVILAASLGPYVRAPRRGPGPGPRDTRAASGTPIVAPRREVITSRPGTQCEIEGRCQVTAWTPQDLGPHWDVGLGDPGVRINPYQ